MDIENKIVEANLTEEQRKTIQDMYKAKFCTEAIAIFVNSLSESSLHGSVEPTTIKSPMKQSTLDKWFVKSSKVPITSEISNSSMSSSTCTTLDSSSNKEDNKIGFKSSNKHLTDQELVKQMGLKQPKLSLHKIDLKNHNAKEGSTAQKGQVIENYEGDSPAVAEKTGAKSFELVEKELMDSHLNMSNSVPTKAPILKMCRSGRHLSVESTEFNSTQSNAVDDILENKPPKENCNFANKNVVKVLSKRSKSYASSDDSSIAEKLVTVDEDFDLRKQSTNDESLTLNIPQSVSAKQQTCKTRQRSKTLCMENSHTTIQLNLTKQDVGIINNEGSVLEFEAPMQISSCINENLSKYSKSDKQNSVTLSPILPNLIPQSGKTEKANKKPETTGIIHKQSGTILKMSGTTKEGNKPDTTGMIHKLFETNKEGNWKSETIEDGYMSENANKKSGTETTVEREEKSIVKMKNKSKKTKKSIQKLETNEEPNKLPETIDKGCKDSEMIEKTNSPVIKKASRKGKNPRRNSKLVTEQSPALDVASSSKISATSWEVAEILVDLQVKGQNKDYPICVDSPSTKNINVSSSEDDKLVSENLQCNAESVGPSQAESDEKQNNYEAFCTLQGVCSSLGIEVEHLFKNRKLTKWLKSSCESDSCAFIQGHKLKKNGQTVSSVYMHNSKKQLGEILKNQA